MILGEDFGLVNSGEEELPLPITAADMIMIMIMKLVEFILIGDSGAEKGSRGQKKDDNEIHIVIVRMLLFDVRVASYLFGLTE